MESSDARIMAANEPHRIDAAEGQMCSVGRQINEFRVGQLENPLDLVQALER